MPVDLRTKPPFPDQVDNTARGDFVACPTKWMYGFLFSITGMAPNVHLHAGGAFAKGLEVARLSFYRDGKSIGEAKRDGLEAIMVSYGNFVPAPTKTGDKSLENVIRAFDSYLQLYPLDRDRIKPFKTQDGKYMIEFTFSIPTEVKNPSTGNPILYSGRCDMIGEMNGNLWVTDEKTTGSLGESWADQWKLESQFTGYCAAARTYGFPVAGALVRGVGLLKTKITHAEVILSRHSWEIDRWWRQLHKDLRRMVQQYEEFDFDLAIAKGACSSYGGCGFTTLCESPEPARWLNQYRIRVWDPLAKDRGEHLSTHPGAAYNMDSDNLEINIKDLM